jgi:hypothetical protein
MSERPPIPAEIKRAVLVESGHRCAIPTCKNPDIDLHHIVPWEKCKKHEKENLIALCPNCHRRAHNGEIDRKSLILYKERLKEIQRTGIEDYYDERAEQDDEDVEEETAKLITKEEFALDYGLNEGSFEFNVSIGTSVEFFYHQRFLPTFPGVRGIRIFDDRKECIQRLSRLLKTPLMFASCKGASIGSCSLVSPIWWWGRGNCQIKDFKTIDDDTVLIDYFEIIPRRIAAVNLGSYRHVFVYVECEPMEPTGLYEVPDEIDGIVSEEYAVFKGRPINRAEYDDGYTEIAGEIVELDATSELRIRHLSPYNFIIAAHSSPINNNEFDDTLEEELDAILNSQSDLRKLTEKIRRLPRMRPEL